MKNLDVMIDNRIRVAQRWHGLEKSDEIAGFVMSKSGLVEEVAADRELSRAVQIDDRRHHRRLRSALAQVATDVRPRPRGQGSFHGLHRLPRKGHRPERQPMKADNTESVRSNNRRASCRSSATPRRQKSQSEYFSVEEFAHFEHSRQRMRHFDECLERPRRARTANSPIQSRT